MPDNYNQKIAAFQDSVFKEIDDKITHMLSDANEERKRVIEEARDEYLNDSFRRISDETKAIKNTCRRRVSKESFESHRALLRERNALIEKFFASLESRLKIFTESAGYVEYFKNSLKEADSEREFYDGVTVQVSPRDLNRSELFGDFPSLKTEASKKIKIGGFTVNYPAEGLYSDLTLDKKLKNEREDFVGNPELAI